MKKVTLLGDSIRLIGYGLKVPELLGSDYTVFQPEDNCRYVKYTLRQLCELKNQIKGSDVIHWNNGHWDNGIDCFEDGLPFTSDEEYVENIIRVAKILKTYGKRVIFATTTPVNGHKSHSNEFIKYRNDLVVPKLQEIGIEINDLYSYAITDVDKFICDDLIHLTEYGINFLAKVVSDKIKEK